jgi:HEAT repeat protein
MLEELDRVNWSQLSHAYGRAADLPNMIRRLAGSGSDTREEVLAELWSSILHQGSLYTATEAAIPFLIELLDEPSVFAKNHVLDLLTGAADSALAVISDRQNDEGIERPVPPHVPAILAAVERAWGPCCRLLLDEDAAVRIGAALLLKSMVNHRAEASSKLMGAIDTDRNDRARAVAVLALALLIERDPRDDAVSRSTLIKLRDVFNEPDSTCAALAAAIAMMRLRIESVIPQMLAREWPALVTEHEFFASVGWERQDWPFSIIARSLNFAPGTQLNWILKGLANADPKVQTAALYAAGDYCRESDLGPSHLAPEAVRLVDSPDENVRRAAVRCLAHMGDVGRACLKPLRHSSKDDVRRAARAVFPHADSDRGTRPRPDASPGLPNWLSKIFEVIRRSRRE